MWQADRAAVNAASGSSAPGDDHGAGTTDGEGVPATSSPPSKARLWARL
jgi:hypothetical protein